MGEGAYGKVEVPRERSLGGQDEDGVPLRERHGYRREGGLPREGPKAVCWRSRSGGVGRHYRGVDRSESKEVSWRVGPHRQQIE